MAKHIQTWGTYWLYGGSGGPANGFDVWGSIQVYLDSQSTTNNTSSLYIDHYVYAKVTGTNLGVQATVTSKYRINNGSYGGTYKSVSKTFSVYPDDGEKSFYIGRTWHTITHNNDGTAKIYVQGNISCDGKSTTSSFTKSITTIDRTSTITATRANIGEVSQLTVTQRNAAYTHSIKYQFGNLSNYILADGTTTDVETKLTETSIGFRIPTTFYSQIPAAKEGTCTLSINTYNGSTKIGSTQTSTFYVDVADVEGNKPSLTTTVVDINDKTKALTDVDTKLIKGYSTARVTYSAAGKNSAAIKSVTINGDVVTSSPKDYANFNANAIEVIATDSRNFTTTKSPTYTPIDYFDPSISISAKRTSPTSNEIKLSFSGNVFNNTFGTVMNELSLSWMYRVRGDSNWTTGGTFKKGTHYVVSGNTFHSGTGSTTSEISLGKLFNYEKNFEIGVTYGDKLYGPVTTVATVSKGKPILNWNDKMVNVNGDLYLNGERFAGGDTLPIGAIIDYDGDTVPEGYELVSETTYSTNEIKTGETWINGKPFYERTFIVGVTSTSAQTILNTSSFNFDMVLIKDAMIININNISYANYYYTSTDFSNIYFRKSNSVVTELMFRGGTQYPVMPATLYITLKYTKTTD